MKRRRRRSKQTGELKSPLPLFDVQATIGRPARPGPMLFGDVESLRAEMARLGIRKALVRHFSCSDSGPFLGNRLLTEAVAGCNDLMPAWCVLPDGAGELGKPADFVSRLIEQGARAAWALPRKMQWFLEDWCCKGLLDALEERRVPLMFSYEDTTPQALDQLLGNHPELPVILLAVSYRLNRVLFPLMERHPNLHLSTGPPFSIHEGIETICERFGPGRLLFGTGLPTCEAGASISALTYARIPARHRRLIACGNLDRLIGEVRT